MGITRDGSVVSNSAEDAGSSLSISVSTSAARRLIVVTLEFIGSTPSVTPTVSGSTLGAFSTVIDTHSGSGDVRAMMFWKWASTQLTSETITASWTSSGTVTKFLAGQGLAGAIDPTSLVANTDYGLAGTDFPSGTPSTSITTKGASGSWIVSTLARFSGTGFTPDANNTLDASFFGAHLGVLQHFTNSVSAGNYTVTGTWTGGDGGDVSAVEILSATELTESASPDVLLAVYGPFGAVAGAYQTTAFQTNAFQEVAGGAGPTTYNEPLTVSTTATDSVVPGLIIPVSVAESASVSEALTTTIAGAISEAHTSTPSILFGFITGSWSATESDQTTASDGLSFSQNISSSLSEAATASDSFATALATVSSSVSESASATESVSPGLAIPVTESDSTSASVADALSFTVAISASSTASDALAAVIVGANDFAESSTATATDSTAQAGAQTFSEIATATDGLSPGNLLSKTISESSTATDAVDSQFPGLCFVSESATASDTFTTAQAGAQTDNHSASPLDDSAPGLVINVTLSESTSATDTVGPGLQLSYTLSENPQATDTVLPGLQFSASVLEQANAAEIVDSLLVTGDRAFAETATATEQFALTQRMLESAANSANASVLLDAVVATPASGTNFYIFICDD